MIDKDTKKLLLVRLSYEDSHYSGYVGVPAGIGILSEVLVYYGIEHEFHDMQINNSTDDLYLKIQDYKPTDIGFSMMTFRYLDNYKLIDSVKKRFPDIRIIAGGPHVTTFREKVLKKCGGIDIAVIMEGEETLVDLCSKKPPEDVPGIIYRKEGAIVSTSPRDLMTDLDKYPFPKLSKFNLKHYSVISIISSRGCPYECIYCPVSTTMGKRWRPRKPEKIVDEIQYWVDRGFGDFQILDDNFTLDKKRVIKICDGIQEHGIAKKINISLGNGIRADRIDRGLLKKMKKSGFYEIAFGVESGSDRVLMTLKKGESLSVIENGIKAASDLGYEVNLFFVLGAPGEREIDLRKSIEVAKKYAVADIAFYHLIPFPGTELYDWVEKHGRFRFRAPEFLNTASHWLNEPLFTTEEMGVEKRKELYALANDEGKKHVENNMGRLMAKRICRKRGLPFALVFPVLILIRNKFVIKCMKNTFIWQRSKVMLGFEK